MDGSRLRKADTLLSTKQYRRESRYQLSTETSKSMSEAITRRTTIVDIILYFNAIMLFQSNIIDFAAFI